MSDHVTKLIDSIREKAVQLHGELQSERSKNEQMKGELSELKVALNAKTSEVTEANGKIAQLEDQVKTLSEQKVDQVSSGNEISDEQIDELVREIEFCIAQLKQ